MPHRGSFIRSVDPPLFNEDWLASPSGNWVLIMQGDGNLVMYPGRSVPVGGTAVFSTGSGGGPPQPYFAALHSDGNLVVYNGRPDSGSTVRYNAETYAGDGEYFLAVQDDGNAVIRRGRPEAPGDVTWVSGTDDALYKSLRWVFTSSRPLSLGAEGKGFVVWSGYAANPWHHPPVRTGDHWSQQQGNGVWEIRITRGSSHGRDCIRNAIADYREGRPTWINWLYAGQSHNEREQRWYGSVSRRAIHIAMRYFNR